MLSVFPIHFLSLFAYFILRIFVGGILFYLGAKHALSWRQLATNFRISWWPFGGFSAVLLATFELIVGSLIIVGAYTQVAALLVALMSLKLFIFSHWFPLADLPSRLFYLLLMAACLSLTITGAGVFAFDLPL